MYGAANQCLIWEVFANRGLGYNASQGNSGDRTDQIEDFNLPPALYDIVDFHKGLVLVTGPTV